MTESSSLLNDDSQEIISKKCSPRKLPRRPMESYILYGLKDDYYLHLLDWSSTNLIAVGIRSRPQIINCTNGKLFHLPDVQCQITCVHWLPQGDSLLIGTDEGESIIFDIRSQKVVTTLGRHRGRVGVAASLPNLISTGSRDSKIFHHDMRIKSDYFVGESIGHKQEVCGLQWSCDGRFLASGGNDNNLLVWNNSFGERLASLKGHQAAVKGLAWSPHARLLASGGGTADRTIRIWDTNDFTCRSVTDAGSQVCNLAWSEHANEIVSTHGFSMFQINLWDASSMETIGSMLGHRKRVLYLAMSPGGETFATASGDGALNLWEVYPKKETRRAEKFMRYSTIR